MVKNRGLNNQEIDEFRRLLLKANYIQLERSNNILVRIRLQAFLEFLLQGRLIGEGWDFGTVINDFLKHEVQARKRRE